MAKLFRKNRVRFNWNLAQRFVNDYRLPIPMLGAKMFEYHLNLYEAEFGAMTKWKELWRLIDDRFDGNEDEFLKEFYNVRERIVTEIPSTEAFKEFNTMDMSVYTTKALVPKHANLYNEENIGKSFLSIDLSKGNFQALNHVDKNILMNSDTYEDFISHFTDLWYVKESKYFRQVVFGQMNPKRHITVEKYLIAKVYDLITSKWPKFSELSVSGADELVFELNDENMFTALSVDFERFVFDELGIKVHTSVFTLNGYDLYSKKEKHKRCTFYTKDYYSRKLDELMCVPLPYYATVYKLMRGMQPNEKDRHFNYENIDCVFNDTFYIKKINK